MKQLAYLFILCTFLACDKKDTKGGVSSIDIKTQEEIDREKKAAEKIKRGEENKVRTVDPEFNYKALQDDLSDAIDKNRGEREMQRVRIEGTFLHGNGKDITLDRLGGEERFTPLVTSIINEDGFFALETKTNQEQIYQLRTDNGTIPMFLVGGNYTFNGNFENMNEYTISNSLESSKLREFFLILEESNARGDKIQKRIDDSKDFDEINNILDSMHIYNDRLYQMKAKSIMNFIERNNNSVLAAIAADKLDYFIHTEYIQKVFDHTYNLFPYSSYVKLLGKKLIRFAPFEIGRTAPEIQLPDINNVTHKLSDYKGKEVLIYFFLSNHDECNDYTDALKGIYERYKPKGFEVLGISIDFEEEAWSSMLVEKQIPWVTVGDLLGEQSSIFDIYIAPSFPSNLYVDRDGKFVARQLDIQSLNDLLSKRLIK